jgi:HD-GYP domain-containing protein (c-di-GMP phosphodiesterase class II)
MISERPYARPRDIPGALDELRRHAGTQFDPVAVTAFCDLIGRRAQIPGLTLAPVS